MIFLLRNFVNLKITPCSLDWVCKILEIWSISWYFWSFKTLFVVSFLAFFSRSFTIAGLHKVIPLVNTNLKDNGYSLHQSRASFWKIIVLDRVFNKYLLFLSLNCIRNELKNHSQPYSCWLDDNIYHFQECVMMKTNILIRPYFSLLYSIILIVFHLLNTSDIT